MRTNEIFLTLLYTISVMLTEQTRLLFSTEVSYGYKPNGLADAFIICIFLDDFFLQLLLVFMYAGGTSNQKQNTISVNLLFKHRPSVWLIMSGWSSSHQYFSQTAQSFSK